MFIVGTVFIIFFILRELRMKAPMLSLEVLKYPTYTLTTVINMIVMMSLYGGMILLPLYLQNLRGFSALDSGLLLLPGALVMGALGPVAGKLLDTIGIKPLAIFGIGIMTYATWELSKLNNISPYYVDIYCAFIWYGVCNDADYDSRYERFTTASFLMVMRLLIQ